jgi:hypothetical protein
MVGLFQRSMHLSYERQNHGFFCSVSLENSGCDQMRSSCSRMVASQLRILLCFKFALSELTETIHLNLVPDANITWFRC